MIDAGRVVPFPPQLRVVPVAVPPNPPAMDRSTLIDHDGRAYPLAELLRSLTPDEMRTVADAAPRSGQELWDEAVRRWPALADEIVARVRWDQ